MPKLLFSTGKQGHYQAAPLRHGEGLARGEEEPGLRRAKAADSGILICGDQFSRSARSEQPLALLKGGGYAHPYLRYLIMRSVGITSAILLLIAWGSSAQGVPLHPGDQTPIRAPSSRDSLVHVLTRQESRIEQPLRAVVVDSAHWADLWERIRGSDAASPPVHFGSEVVIIVASGASLLPGTRFTSTALW
jgi:hypothetical protein